MIEVIFPKMPCENFWKSLYWSIEYTKYSFTTKNDLHPQIKTGYDKSKEEWIEYLKIYNHKTDDHFNNHLTKIIYTFDDDEDKDTIMLFKLLWK